MIGNVLLRQVLSGIHVSVDLVHSSFTSFVVLDSLLHHFSNLISSQDICVVFG